MSLLTLEWREESGEKLGERSLTYLPQCVRFLSRRACRSRSAAISAARLWTCAQLIPNSALRLFSRSRSPHASTCTMSGRPRRRHGVSKMRRVLRSVNLFKGFVPSFTVLRLFTVNSIRSASAEQVCSSSHLGGDWADDPYGKSS